MYYYELEPNEKIILFINNFYYDKDSKCEKIQKNYENKKLVLKVQKEKIHRNDEK